MAVFLRVDRDVLIIRAVASAVVMPGNDSNPSDRYFRANLPAIGARDVRPWIDAMIGKWTRQSKILRDWRRVVANQENLYFTRGAQGEIVVNFSEDPITNVLGENVARERVFALPLEKIQPEALGIVVGTAEKRSANAPQPSSELESLREELRRVRASITGLSVGDRGRIAMLAAERLSGGNALEMSIAAAARRGAPIVIGRDIGASADRYRFAVEMKKKFAREESRMREFSIGLEFAACTCADANKDFVYANDYVGIEWDDGAPDPDDGPPETSAAAAAAAAAPAAASGAQKPKKPARK